MIGQRRHFRWSTEPIARRLADLDAARVRAFRRGDKGWEIDPDALADLVNRHLLTVANILSTYSTIGETRVDADSQFFLDTGNVSRALLRIRQRLQKAGSDPDAAYAAAEPIKTLLAAYRILEAAHDASDVGKTADEMKSVER
jgi:hypothetical protein